MKHVTKFQKSIFVSLAVLGFVGGMQTSDIINSGDGSAIPTIEAASVRRGQQRINGKWYLFDNNGHYKTGFQWIPEQRKTVYYARNGQMQYGQQRINGHWYLFDNVTGAMKTGFQWIANQHKTVYYAGNGQMQYGQQRINGNWYLLDNCTGAMKTGFQWIANQRKTVYYAGNGQMQYGQQRINGHWYLFDNCTGAMKTGFQWIANQRKTVYYAGNGQMQYGQQRINGHWYLFDNCTGAMKSGLQYIANQRKTVYYAGNGQMQYGYQTVNGHHYYFNTVTGALEPLPSTGSSKTYTPSNQSTFSLNGHSYAVKSFSGTGTVPADNYVYAWTSLRNYYLFEYYGNAHKELASLHVGSPVVINGQTLHVREIITNVSNDGNAYDLVARKMQQYKAGWQTCEYAAYGSTLRLWFAN